VTGDLVFDSGDAFEQLTASLYPSAFNCSNSGIARDGRSPTKRPEPEGVVLGKVAGRMLAFVGLERIGGIVVHDVSDPFAPRLLDYLNTRIFTTSSDLATAGDLGPEGLLFIRADPRPSAAHPPVRLRPLGRPPSFASFPSVKGPPSSVGRAKNPRSHGGRAFLAPRDAAACLTGAAYLPGVASRI